MTRQPQFEIVKTTAGVHARLRSSNGRIIWSSKVYRRPATAERAIALITGWAVLRSEWGAVVRCGEREIPVRYLDERGGGS